MKRVSLIAAASSVLLLGGGSSALIFAQPASFGVPDITLSGIEYNKISGYYPGPPQTGDPADEGQDGCTWYPDGTAIFTFWDHGGETNHYGHCLWVLYVAELTPGYWRLGLNAINRNPHGAGIDHERYPRFEVLVELEGPPNHSDSAVVFVPASDVEVRSGHRWFRIPGPGLYGIKYTWLNDDGGPDWDANIMIDSVFFDKWSRRRE
jgi:hypothetical protein